MRPTPWLPLLLQVIMFLPHALHAKRCDVKLPLFNSSVRIVGGHPASSPAFDNIVTLAYTDNAIDYVCVGSLIHPQWVLTAAQCPIAPTQNFVLYGGSSLTGTRYEIKNVSSHPLYDPSSTPWRYDLQLVQLQTPIRTLSESVPISSTSPNSQDVLPLNAMRVNNNTAFAQSPRRTYLRLKGYGLSQSPLNNQEPLRYRERPLLFADMPITACPNPLANDGALRLCTEPSGTCGPCFGDTGSPLYDIDQSGTVAVLVAVATLGRADTFSIRDPFCTNGRVPIIYTTVAPHLSWIRRTIGNATLSEFYIPPSGINNIVLASDKPSLGVVARTSIIVVCTFVLAGILITLIVCCSLRHLRARRRRWQSGLAAEHSFINPRSPDVFSPDPFEGMHLQNKRRSTMSLSQMSSSAIERLKRTKEFSTRSLAAIRARRMKEEKLPANPPREPVPDAPEWVSPAWEKLFKTPSKSDLSAIHKVPTQRVVDDVLSGTDKSVEPSLNDVAFHSAREEANLEAAWQRLELQTSLRNMSEAGSANITPPLSPLPQSPGSGSRGKLNGLSRSGSKRGSGLSSPLRRALSPAPRAGPGELTKADTLLAAFASIDAESEHVEETVVDSTALRALANAKRPNMFNALRRMFSGPGTNGSASSNRSGPEGGNSTDRLTMSHRNGSSNASAQQDSFALSSKQGSMYLDYFSENYSLSDSGSEDGERVLFEQAFMAGTRRYTEDRRPGEGEGSYVPTLRGYRKGPSHSLQELQSRRLSGSMDEDEAESPEIKSNDMVNEDLDMQLRSSAQQVRGDQRQVGHWNVEDESSRAVHELWPTHYRDPSNVRTNAQASTSSVAQGGPSLPSFRDRTQISASQTRSILDGADVGEVRFEGDDMIHGSHVNDVIQERNPNYGESDGHVRRNDRNLSVTIQEEHHGPAIAPFTGSASGISSEAFALSANEVPHLPARRELFPCYEKLSDIRSPKDKEFQCETPHLKAITSPQLTPITPSVSSNEHNGSHDHVPTKNKVLNHQKRDSGRIEGSNHLRFSHKRKRNESSSRELMNARAIDILGGEPPDVELEQPTYPQVALGEKTAAERLSVSELKAMWTERVRRDSMDDVPFQ